MAKYQVMPDLTQEEYEQLKESIRKNGVLVPIIMDKDGAVIDGHNRYDIAQELKAEGMEMEIPVQISDLTDENKKRQLAYELNLQRRHLSMRDKKKSVEKMLVEFPEMSNRQAAKLAKIDDKTVGKIRKELEDDGKIEEVDVSVGMDGKTRKKLSAEIPQSEPEEIEEELPFTPEPELEEIVDEIVYLKVGIMQGNVIRTTVILDGFKARSKKTCPVEMIDTIVNVVNSAKLPPNEEGWNMVKKIVEEHAQIVKDMGEIKEPEPVTPEPEVIPEVVEEKPVSSKREKIMAELEEINKTQAEQVTSFIKEEVDKVAGALKSPVFSKWLSKEVKKKLKAMGDTVDNANDTDRQEFVNAWNVIKQFIERG